tara:strand:+ start:119 stop:829 length:711 start_codon:yes stop_codon:yes gene_type:complete
MFIISEISPQFSGSIDLAKRMIYHSFLSGASLIKLQLYPKNMFSNDGLDRSYLELSFENFKMLKEYGDQIGIEVFATPFTDETLKWCLDLKVKYLKIASRTHDENPELVEKIINQNILTFVSLSDKNIDQVNKFKNYKNLILLYCISNYPTLLSEAKIPGSFEKFDGISDHSLGISYALKACALGAKYLEKHFTLNKNLQRNTEKGHLGAMDPNDLKLIKEITDEMELIEKIDKKI